MAPARVDGAQIALPARVASHDQLFKVIFDRRLEAASLLASCLPIELAALIDWSTLQNVSPEFIGPDLVRRQSDLVFLVTSKADDAQLVVLLEHQSSVDELMPLRAQAYVLRILEKHQRDRPNAPLPVVVPVVVNQGAAPWNPPTRLSELVEPRLASRFAAFVPNFHFLLIDLSRLTDAALRAKAMTPAATLAIVVLTQCRGVEQPERVLENWFDQLLLVANGVDGVNLLTSLGSYVAQAAAGSPAGLRLLFERLGETGKEAFVTMAEMMGREARQQGAASILLRQLGRKFGTVPDELQRRVAGGSEAELARWAEQVLEAQSLAECLK